MTDLYYNKIRSASGINFVSTGKRIDLSRIAIQLDFVSMNVVLIRMLDEILVITIIKSTVLWFVLITQLM